MKTISSPYGTTEIRCESDMSADLVEKMHMIPAASLEQAIAPAKKLLAKNEVTITAIPDGVSVVVM